VAAAVPGVELVRLHAEELGDFLHDDIVNKYGEVARAMGPRLDRPAVDHEPSRKGALRWETPRERHPRTVPVLQRRDIVDSKLDPRQLIRPTPPQMFDGVNDQVVEPGSPASAKRNVERRQRPTHATAVPVPARAGARGAAAHRAGGPAAASVQPLPHERSA
jgi:hypothetical protein